MKLYLVRHAQSMKNAYKGGHSDSKLSEVGKEQARRLGVYFKNKKIDIIYCSTLVRAKDTLNEIKKYLPEIKIIYTNKIIEQKMGVYDKVKNDWRAFSDAAEKSGKQFHLFKPKNGESLLDVYKRARKFYRFLLSNKKIKNILVIGHGIFTTFLIFNALNLDVTEGKYYSLSNASVSILEINKNNKVIDFHVNDYKHLIEGGMKSNK